MAGQTRGHSSARRIWDLSIASIGSPGFSGGSSVWKDESHDKGNHATKTDDASVSQTGEGPGGPSSVRAPEGARHGTGRCGEGRGPVGVRHRVATSRFAQAVGDAWDVSDWECQLALQDALRTRFIENWCKVVQTVEYSKPLLRLRHRVYPPVRGLWRNGLLIRRLEVRVLPGVPR